MQNIFIVRPFQPEPDRWRFTDPEGDEIVIYRMIGESDEGFRARAVALAESMRGANIFRGEYAHEKTDE